MNLVDDLKQASVESLQEQTDAMKEQALDAFSKFTKLIRKYKKTQAQLNELEMLHKDNIELQQYICCLAKINELEVELDKAKKGYLYESAILAPNVLLENTDVKVSVVLPHTRDDFDKDKFIEQYGIDEYNKFVVKKDVKGNIKFKIKENK